jgi:two-component system CheB/CheR fusion protein
VSPRDEQNDKRTSLVRRVDRRLSQAGIGGYAEYIDHLQVNSEEFVALFNTILINVTGFLPGPGGVPPGRRPTRSP